MNLQIDKKESLPPSDKALAVVATDVYTQLRASGMRPRDVITVASHLLTNVLKALQGEETNFSENAAQ